MNAILRGETTSTQRDRTAPRNGFRLLSFLLFFVFGGAIVGETVALSIVVSLSGIATLGRMFIINGLLLFGLPLIFFRNVDRFRRENLLGYQLLISVALLALYLGLFSARSVIPAFFAQALLMVIYPLSYLSKTVNFLTFWTLANDICDTGESKKQFPIVAAWGFAGGLIGSLVALGLLQVVEAETVIWLWMLLYLTAWVLVKRVRRQFWDRLQRTETVHPRRENIVKMVRDVVRIRLVRSMALIYFLVFVGVFSLDFLFWKQCHRWFTTSNSLASFQFSFYLTHAVVTIAALYFILPSLISRWGFVKIMYSLPVVLLTGASMLLAVRAAGVEPRFILAGTIVFQFARYVVFENAFSPIYQMFFVAIPAERRGRAKTVLEGIVKPSALITAGLYLSNSAASEAVVLMVAVVSGGGLIYLVSAIRKTYIEELLPRAEVAAGKIDVVSRVGSAASSEIVSLAEAYACSLDPDLRALAVRLIASRGSRESYVRLKDFFESEKHPLVRETIARSIGEFYWYEAKGFVEKLLNDVSPRVKANALTALAEVNARWKWDLRLIAQGMLFDNSLRVQLAAARFLWGIGDTTMRQQVQTLMNTLRASQNPNKRSAGLYLTGTLQPQDWEAILVGNLTADSPDQVFIKSAETVFLYASDETRLSALERVEPLSRERIAMMGKAAQTAGEVIVSALLLFLTKQRSQRVTFEIVHALRVIKLASPSAMVSIPIDTRTERNILYWILRELRTVYGDAAVWGRLTRSGYIAGASSGGRLLEEALRERVYRVAGWALDALVLLDTEGLVTWGRRDLDVHVYGSRLDMIEILESLGGHRIGSLVVPLLKFESWDSIARQGGSRFKRWRGQTGNGLEHFAHSENRWVVLCALYALYQTVPTSRLVREESGTLERLCSDSYRHVAQTAAALRDSVSGGLSHVHTFELLETVLFLKQTPLFGTLPGEKLMPVAEICEMQTYEKDTVISREGEISDNLYIVKSGTIEIVKNSGGTKKVLALLHPNMTYGEIGMFSQSQRSATAIAMEDCCVYEIQRSALKKLLLKMPEVALNLLKLFSEKLKRSGEEALLLETTETQAAAVAAQEK